MSSSSASNSAARSGFAMTIVSVTSSSRCCGGTPVSTSASRTVVARSRLCNNRADRLTATVRSGRLTRHRAVSRQWTGHARSTERSASSARCRGGTRPGAAVRAPDDASAPGPPRPSEDQTPRRSAAGSTPRSRHGRAHRGNRPPRRGAGRRRCADPVRTVRARHLRSPLPGTSRCHSSAGVRMPSLRGRERATPRCSRPRRYASRRARRACSTRRGGVEPRSARSLLPAGRSPRCRTRRHQAARPARPRGGSRPVGVRRREGARRRRGVQGRR